MIYKIILNQFDHNDGYPGYILEYLDVQELQVYMLNKIQQYIGEGESEKERESKRRGR